MAISHCSPQLNVQAASRRVENAFGGGVIDGKLVQAR